MSTDVLVTLGSAYAFDAVGGLVVFVLATFIGFEVILRVPTLLHTPLMSGSNAISGIILVGGILLAGNPHVSTFSNLLGLLGIVLATVNVVGGFVVTDRMLQMFRRKPEAPRPPAAGGSTGGAA